MRPLPAATLAGSLLLGLAIAPSASATGLETPAPTPTATVTDAPGALRDSSITLSPLQAPAGAKLTVSDPADPCLTEDGRPGEVLAGLPGEDLIDVGRPDQLRPPVQHTFTAGADGGFSTTLTVPATAHPSDEFFAWVACFTPGADPATEAPLVYYGSRIFVVSRPPSAPSGPDAPGAPVATPVEGDPSFTG